MSPTVRTKYQVHYCGYAVASMDNVLEALSFADVFQRELRTWPNAVPESVEVVKMDDYSAK